MDHSYSVLAISLFQCKHHFKSEERANNPERYGHGIASWCVYSNVAWGVNMLQTSESLADVFGDPSRLILSAVTCPTCVPLFSRRKVFESISAQANIAR
jgi:hypothetical protein